MKNFNQYLLKLQDHRKDAILKYHKNHLNLMKLAKGSSNNHQSWKGGYEDHITECMMIAHNLFVSLSKVRALPFSLDSAIIVLYFHDIEKIYKYGSKKIINKTEYFQQSLHKMGIMFSKEEMNALQYVHGENEDYTPNKRVMGELAAFCHVVDTISARIWHSFGMKRGAA